MEKKILVIDDLASNLQAVIDHLQTHAANYFFVQAPNGEIGLQLAQKYLPDIVLVDWEMPGMSGLQFIRQLQLLPGCASIPAIIITGIMTSPENLQLAFEAGAVDFIRKPIIAVELRARVHSALQIAELHQQQIESKKRELTHLSINLLQKNELQQSLIRQLRTLTNNQKMSTTLRLELQRITTDIQADLGEQIWRQLETLFLDIDPGFLARLGAKYPDLSPTEVKIAVLIRINMSTKDIANVLNITTESTKVARSRLRKRLNIDQAQSLTITILGI